jgi:hypothetical protein
VEPRAGDGEIEPENIKAVQAVYAAYQLEQLRLFDVADKLVEVWESGVLPIGGRGGRSAFVAYQRGSGGRLSEAERLAIYARSFGLPGGDPAVTPNREFAELWLRFVRAVRAFVGDGGAAKREAIRKTGRDLAANVCVHGVGSAPAAASLARQTNQALLVLQTAAVRRAYGGRKAWDVLDRVACLELGGVPDTVRLRTLAQSGGTIIGWLATRTDRLSSRASVIDTRDLRRQRKSATPLETPTDRDLVDACGLWLAVRAPAKTHPKPPRADPRTLRAVRRAVRALLDSSKAFSRLPAAEQKSITRRTVKLASFMAEPHGHGASRDVDFPAFVSDLVKGVFEAIVDSSIEQMRAYGDLVKNVTKAVDEFAHDAVTDDAARRWLGTRYSCALALTFVEKKTGRLAVISQDPESALRKICTDLGVRDGFTKLDAVREIELVRHARVRIARNRQRLLASTVTLGIERIVRCS